MAQLVPAASGAATARRARGRWALSISAVVVGQAALLALGQPGIQAESAPTPSGHRAESPAVSGSAAYLVMRAARFTVLPEAWPAAAGVGPAGPAALLVVRSAPVDTTPDRPPTPSRTVATSSVGSAYSLAAAGSRARRVTDSVSDWASFTLVDRVNGRAVGDGRSAQVTNVESVVKAWLAADLLASTGGGRSLRGWQRRLMARMIRESDNNAAEVIYRWLGGDASIRRMIRICRMTDTTTRSGWWSMTQISARDMARLGSCLVPGRGRLLTAEAGAELLGLMRSVVRSNAFGIPEARPADAGGRVAVKNGWTEHGRTGQWNVNCLAIWGPGLRWVLAVTVRYPIPRGLPYGALVCRRVTRALFP